MVLVPQTHRSLVRTSHSGNSVQREDAEGEKTIAGDRDFKEALGDSSSADFFTLGDCVALLTLAREDYK